MVDGFELGKTEFRFFSEVFKGRISEFNSNMRLDVEVKVKRKCEFTSICTLLFTDSITVISKFSKLNSQFEALIFKNFAFGTFSGYTFLQLNSLVHELTRRSDHNVKSVKGIQIADINDPNGHFGSLAMRSILEKILDKEVI
ncbi:hypothetical protein BLOT_016065 [Blomia tropicalis]|nr:hypothetical protein BLOT_016065 [Blomia tropicalis]